MKITSVATSLEGPSQTLPKTWQILTPVGEPPLRYFEQVLYLRFATGEAAERLAIDVDTAAFRVTFKPNNYVARPDSPVPRKVNLSDHADHNDTVIVAFDAPRQVQQVYLTSDIHSANSLAFYRLDGTTLAGEPTVEADIQTVGQPMSTVRQAMTVKDPANPGDLVNVEAMEVGPGVKSETAVREIDPKATAVLPANTDFTDVRFALRAKPRGKVGLLASHIAGLQFKSYPTGPRLGLGNVDDPASALFFWQVPGEVGKSVPADQGNANVGEALAQALQRYLDDFFARLAEDVDEDGQPQSPPAYIDVALVAASDAPCSLEILDVDLTFRLVQQTFPAGEEKQVLRLATDGVDTQTVPIQLPGNVEITTAELKIVPSFRGDHLVGSDEETGGLATKLTSKSGIHLGLNRWAAQVVTPPQAISVSGLSLALMATATATEVLVELQEAWHGQPSGNKLAEGMLKLEQVGRCSWATLLFPQAIILPSQPHWILVKTAKGQAVWLAESGTPPVRVLEPSGQQNWSELGILDGIQALHRFFSRTAHSQQVQEEPPLTFTVGNIVVTPMPKPVGQESGGEADAQNFDLTDALNSYLATQQSLDSPVTTPLTFTAGLSGILTVYPPYLEYNLTTEPE